MRPSNTAMRGYSLVEALVVVAIVGVISLVSVPNFMAMYRSMKIKTAVRQFSNDVRSARQEAVSRYRPVMVTVGTSTADRHTYWIYLWNPATSSWDLRKTGELEPQTALENRTVFFTGVGFPDSSGPGSPPALDTRPDVIFESTGAIRTPPVDPTLRIRTEANISKNEFILTISPSGSIRAE
ncbi:MAG TPA: GspH/FimT family pseudopilin [Thermoanaerobaculia bacterium]|nr:GspH/FimT family pseudopilin [Thermoanaerobaculia bacterium]